MNIEAPPRMTVDEFLVWAEGRPGRYELVEGVVCQMSPERARHAETKFAAAVALARGIERAGVDYHVMPDGMTVRITDKTAFEPDALVYPGPRIAADSIEVERPLIVVEVISPSTSSRDTGTKLKGYFSVSGLVHYLIVDATGLTVVHHRQSEDGTIVTRIVTEGVLRLDPPGLEVPVAEMLAP